MTRASAIILAPLSAIYGSLSEARLSLYRRGVLKVSRLEAPVISVGNITAGGTGKTPLVEYLARTLAATGRRVCILSRGYGRQNARARVVVSDGDRILANEIEAGDEPLELAQKLQGVAAVISDADRYAAGQWAISELGAEVFVLDDGFQHLQLARNLNLVTVDATAPWGQGQLLPLRERRSGLTRADCILITRADQAENLETLKSEIARASDNRPLLPTRMKVRRLRKLDELSSVGEQAEIVSPVAVFCAIGNHQAFTRQIADLGYEVVAATPFRDHHRYIQRDITEVIGKAKAAGARSLVTTAKDAVKLRDFNFELPCYVCEIEISIDDEPRLKQMVLDAVSGRNQ
jgi:tetraacyldisaccharide 4'-kinase